MLLAGDIGGTKTKLAVLSPESGLVPQAQATFKSGTMWLVFGSGEQP